MLTLGITSPLFTSCGEDPDLKARREAQTRKIVEMESRIAILRERMRAPVPDRTAKLNSARRAAETLQGTVKEKELDLARIESAVETSERELDEFQRKHKIPGGSTR